MNAFEMQRRALAAFPPALKSLIDAELAAGNEIAGIGQWFPAPPIGAFVMLARPVTSRPRDAADGLRYRDRHGSIYTGEFTDAREQYFVLTMPLPPASVLP